MYIYSVARKSKVVFPRSRCGICACVCVCVCVGVCVWMCKRKGVQCVWKRVWCMCGCIMERVCLEVSVVYVYVCKRKGVH